MSNSDGLSKTISENKIASEQSVIVEKSLREVSNDVFDNLKKEFPNYHIHFKSRLMNEELCKIKDNNFILLECVENGEIIKTCSDNKETWISPDGGIIFIKTGETNRIILVSEAKIQGTNDKREKENKKEQAQGNAIERAAKNIIQIHQCMFTEDIVPYVLFASGCDFKEKSTITERVRCFVWNREINKIYVKNVIANDGRRLQGISLFARVKPWTYDEMYNVLHSVAVEAIHYYEEKYIKSLNNPI